MDGWMDGWMTHDRAPNPNRPTSKVPGAIKKFSVWPSCDQNKIKILFASYSINAKNTTCTIRLLGYKYLVHFSI